MAFAEGKMHASERCPVRRCHVARPDWHLFRPQASPRDGSTLDIVVFERRAGERLASLQRERAEIAVPSELGRQVVSPSIGELREWIDWAARHGVGFIQLLPINENGTEESPYSGISSIALDPIYLTITRREIPWLAAKEITRARERMDGALEAEHVDYPVVRKAKRNLLELAWAGFDEAPPALAGEFERFMRASPGATLGFHVPLTHFINAPLDACAMFAPTPNSG
jgi:hypothetical protein